MQNASLAVTTTLALFCCIPTTRADTLETTRGEPIREVAHSVEVSIDDGVATYRVRRSFLNEGDRADQVYLEIQLPGGAAATGLRIRANGEWFEGEWMDRQEARDLYEELTGVGPHQPKDPVLLEWGESDELRMHIFPVFADRASTVEYTLRAPTEYRDGTYRLTYPDARETSTFVDPVVTVRPGTPGAPIRVSGRRTTAGQPVALSTDGKSTDRSSPEPAAIEVDPAIDRPFRTRLGRVRAGGDTAFTRFEMDLAPTLSDLPAEASFVFLVDASHSVDDSTLDAQLQAIRGMLHHVPDAEFTVVAYRRFPSQLGRGFVPATEVDRTLRRARDDGFFERANGSHLDRAMNVGAQQLADRDGPTYLVGFTDHLLRPAWSNDLGERAMRKLPDRTTVHLVEPHGFTSGAPELDRTDDDSLASLALDRGGIMVELAGELADRPKRRNRTLLHLVRPTRIEHVAFHGIALDNPPETLEEGAGLREMYTTADAPRRARITGKLWAEPVRHVATVDRRFSRATAGFVFSRGRHRGLSGDQMRRVARFGRAVSPVTSYLAIEPGVRPSTIGIDRGAAGLGAVGAGAGGGGDVGDGPNSESDPLDVADHLRPRLQECLSDHDPADSWGAELRIETTRREIVDVYLDNNGTDAPALEQCVTETAWETDLPADARYHTRNDFDLTLP